ncbi:hypothetical protein AURDEDRAFT_116134 [Neofusicoccum parvum]|nr:hypothetical protein AURDEDRAFT_116134 [Neofusicoccum parvum]
MTANETTNGAAAAAPTNPKQNTATTTTISERPSLTLHRPSSSDPNQPAPPHPGFFGGTWHITHSTMPIWRDKRNVTITYTLLPDTPSPRLDDVVAYQPCASDTTWTVRGTQTPTAGGGGAIWDWRGKGLIWLASTRWELLGRGGGEGEEEEQAWMVTFSTKTVFTPAGVNVYGRGAGAVGAALLDAIRDALVATRDPELARLAAELYELARGPAPCG